MPAEGRENPLLKKGNSDAFFREKYLTKNMYRLKVYRPLYVLLRDPVDGYGHERLDIVLPCAFVVHDRPGG